MARRKPDNRDRGECDPMIGEEENPGALTPGPEVTSRATIQANPSNENSAKPALGEVLDQVRSFLELFISYPDSGDSAVAHTLWIAHAHAIECFETTPRLAFLSPEPGSGKSRAMELTEALTPRAVLSTNASVSYIFRKISDPEGLPTLLLDEIDTIFSNRAGESSEDLRGLLNSGYRRGAVVGRAATRGKEIVAEDWPSFCAVALAGLNSLPDTVATRAVIVPMKKRPSGVKIRPFRRRTEGPQADRLRALLGEIVGGLAEVLSRDFPILPPGITDRDADVWEPLIAIADQAGGKWASDARLAAARIMARSKEKGSSLGVLLLADIRRVLGDRERISTVDLLQALHELDEAPWASIKDKPIDARFLARMLGRYDVSPARAIRVAGQVVKGHERGDFLDAWDRYLQETEAGEETEGSDDEPF